jgi:glycogen phosphorylase
MRAAQTFTVAVHIPEALHPLDQLARNLSWASSRRVQELFARLASDGWHTEGFQPLRLLADAPRERLLELATDQGFVARAGAVLDRLEIEMQQPTWFALEHHGDLRAVAYFSPEFGVAEALPQYSGGLGVLAGDHLKAASDLGVPLVGVGLFYRHGYFHQEVDPSGWQQERYPNLVPAELPLDDTGLIVSVTLAGVPARVRVWRARVGRVPLYLLDTAVEGNDEATWSVTDRLYGGGQEQRIRQEIVLGVGGIRALRALGVETQIFHMNEGHAGFLGLERIRTFVAEGGLRFHEAVEAARAATLFTTHTPVPAGIDRFPRALIDKYFADWAEEVGVTGDDLMALGAEPGGPADEFNMAAMGLRLSCMANGVAALHGATSRAMFAGLWSDVPVDEVPIGSVTNGVHLRSWTSPAMADLFDRHLGSDWADADEEQWGVLDKVADSEIWATREAARRDLVNFVRRRLRARLEREGATPAQVDWCDEVLDPEVLTIGFARRFAPYKRATLLLRDPERLRRLALDADRPVQFVFAGKAHPADHDGKGLLQAIARTALDPDLRRRVALIEDYDIAVARELCRGVDVWLNTPRRPMEACGTSGMKVVLNGVLNCSVLDGWWAEMYDPTLGWAIPSARGLDDLDQRDHAEAESLYRLLEDDIVPEFYERGPAGTPTAWLARVRHSMKTLGPKVAARRMVVQYVTDWYEPLAGRADAHGDANLAGAREYAAWRARVEQRWPSVRITGVRLGDPDESGARVLTATVDLGGLVAGDVAVQAVHGRVDGGPDILDPHIEAMDPAGDGTYRQMLEVTRSGTYGVNVRVVPHHRAQTSWAELGLVAWASDGAVESATA